MGYSPDDPPSPGRRLIESELWEFLSEAHEVHLATVYRTLIDRMGREVSAHVAEAIGHLLHEGAIEIESRSAGPDGSTAVVVRLSRRAVTTD